MANRFCASCGAKLLSEAKFCVECGEPQPGTKVARGGSSAVLQRYAPVFVVLAVLAIGGGAVVFGTLSPKTPPTMPRHEGAQGSQGPAAAEGQLPAGHPPITVPDEVKQAMRDMAAKAAAAPDDMDTWKRLAEVQYRAAQLDPTLLVDAEKSYLHVLEHEPNNADVIRALGNVAFDLEKSDQAIEYYKRYLTQKPGDLEVQTDLGTMYLSSHKIDEALKQYEAVLKMDPSFFQAQFNMAIAYRTMGDAAKTLEALEKSRALAPDDKTRSQIDQLIARGNGQPAPMEAAAGQAPGMQAPAEEAPMGQAPVGQAAAPQAGAPAGTFQADAENVFRQNPILGPKVGRIEWSGAETAKVYLHDFPMDQMPDEMKTMFADRMKDRIKEKKTAHQVTATATFDLVDEATGKVLTSITE